MGAGREQRAVDVAVLDADGVCGGDQEFAGAAGQADGAFPD
ncbi:hypothetical protein [Streptomyces sp. NPDC059639]